MAQQESGREPLAGAVPALRAAAVVAAYNEGRRIIAVLEALHSSPHVAEIVVVDDGSDVSMAWIVEQFPHVRFFRHETNEGKAAALETGVRETTGELLFFCDADLVGFKADYVSELIAAVQSGEHEMSIGLRNNPAQRAVYLFALNSGERCLKRSDWLRLSAFYKRGFRIETGLNIARWREGKRIFHKQYPYTQTVREQKYGLVKGFTSRVRMSVDVLSAWMYALLSGK